VRIKVSAQIPSSVFTSIWDDQVEAQQEYQRFASNLWRGDLEPLQAAGVGVTVQVEIGSPQAQPKPGIEVEVEPYVGNAEALDMMAQTRAMLTTRDDVWDRWMKSPAAKALYRG
jgi:hypothetical protein